MNSVCTLVSLVFCNKSALALTAGCSWRAVNYLNLESIRARSIGGLVGKGARQVVQLGGR